MHLWEKCYRLVGYVRCRLPGGMDRRERISLEASALCDEISERVSLTGPFKRTRKATPSFVPSMVEWVRIRLRHSNRNSPSESQIMLLASGRM